MVLFELILLGYIELLTNLWNNQPNVVIGVGVATALLLGIYIFLLDITK